MAKRVMTSAIPGQTVTNVRKCLSQMRKSWSNASSETPFFLCVDTLLNMTVSEFAFQFVRGHYQKRLSKCRKNKSEKKKYIDT